VSKISKNETHQPMSAKFPGILLFLLFSFISSFAQNFTVNGKVVDSESKKPLAFVNIVINSGNRGDVSDIDGKFRMKSAEPIKTLKFSYVGYQLLKLEINKTKDIVVLLQRIPLELQTVEILPGINPAHRIIENVIKNKDANDPEKLKSFSYTSYDKVIFEPDMDSISLADSARKDTSYRKIKNFINKQHFFMMENVAQRKFLYPDKDKQNVIATRISGLSDPLFVFLISQVQSNSFYKEIIKILDKNYISPISSGSTSKYFFDIKDTLYSQDNRDTTFVIFYRPFIGKKFDGLKGLLYINSHGWAIQNVIAEPSEKRLVTEIKIQQKYELVDSVHWFPVQLNTDIIFRGINVTIDSGRRSFPMIARGKSYLRDIQLNSDIVKRDFDNVKIDVDPKASQKPEAYWNNYRVDSLTAQDRETYRVIDSIGKAEHFDRYAKGLETILKGKIPYRWLDFDMGKFVRYNPHEGFYLGLGAETNDKLSRKFNLGGYWGYGFGDKMAKYGGNIRLSLYRPWDMEAGASYHYDVSEAAAINTFGSGKILSEEGFRDYLLRRLDNEECKEAWLSFRTLRYMKLTLALSQSTKTPEYNYFFGNDLIVGPQKVIQHFHFTELSAGFRYAYKEKFLQNVRSKISLGTNYPIVYFRLTRGLTDFLGGDFEYTRLDLKVEKTFFTKYLGKTSFTVFAGYIDGKIPYCNLFNGHGSYRAFTIYAPNSFATMRLNEFTSNRYASVFLTHNFGKLLISTKHFKPELAIATNAGFGWLNNAGTHTGIDVKSYDKGYYESGFLINKLINFQVYTLGVGAFYRYGPYSFEKFSNNLGVKVSITFPM